MERDQLRFTVERHGDHVGVRCTGFDRTGQGVDFGLDAPGFRANSFRQFDWATRVEAVDQIMQAYVAIGVDPDKAWKMVEHVLPEDMHLGTGWRSAPLLNQGGADLRNQPLQRVDDLGRQTGDGDR